VAVYPRRPAVQASARRLIIDGSSVQLLRYRPMPTEAKQQSLSIGSPSSSLSKTSSYLHYMTDQSALMLTPRREGPGGCAVPTDAAHKLSALQSD
jgi:hypothetical protein